MRDTRTARMTRTRKLIWLGSIGAMLMAAGGNAGVAAGTDAGASVAASASASDQAPAAAAASYRLASAQVVTSTVKPPVLKLTANGPIAFEVLPADPGGSGGAGTSGGRIVARLYGVAPADLASFGDLTPFALAATAVASANGSDTDTIITITTGAVSAASGQALVLRAGMKSNEIEAAIVPAS
jgi:hypothetical protein